MAKGRLGTRAKELWAAIDAISVRLNEPVETENYSFQTSFGTIQLNSQHCRAVEQALAKGPKSFAQLKQELSLNNSSLIEIIAMLLHGQRLGIDRGEAGSACAENVIRVNQTLRQLQLQGRPYLHFASAAIGSAVTMGHVESLLHHKTKPEKLSQALAEFGYNLSGNPHELARNFTRRRPFLEALGVI